MPRRGAGSWRESKVGEIVPMGLNDGREMVYAIEVETILEKRGRGGPWNLKGCGIVKIGISGDDQSDEAGDVRVSFMIEIKDEESTQYLSHAFAGPYNLVIAFSHVSRDSEV